MRVKISSVLTGMFGIALIVSFAIFITLVAISLRSNALSELDTKFQAILDLNEQTLINTLDRNKLLTGALAEDFMIVKAFVDLKKGFEASNTRNVSEIYKSAQQDRSSILRGRGGELYEYMHETHHTQIRQYLRTSYFSDILLLDLQGNVFYSYEKSDEFARNINDKKLTDQKVLALREILGKVGEDNRVFTGIYEHNMTDSRLISVFPVKINNRKIGYLATATPFSHVSKNLGAAGILGKTGSVVLLQATGRPLAWKGPTSEDIRRWELPAGLSLNGTAKSGSVREVRIGGNAYHAVVKPLQYDGQSFSLMIYQAGSEILANSRNLQTRLVIVGIAILCTALLIVIFITRQISQPLARVTSELMRVTSGNLVASSPIKSRYYEILNISDALTAFRDSVTERQKLEKNLVDRSLEMEMLNEELKYANRELEQYRDHLEDLVRTRTEIIGEQANKLETALAAEKELNNLQRSFVSMATHEFRTPLAIIDTVAQKILRRADRIEMDKLMEYANKIRSAVRRMTSLMESTLSAARMENGKIQVSIKACNLRYLLTECCRNQQELTPSHRIALNIDEAPNTIMADPAALEQVVTNLLSNAVKYSPGCPDIEVTATSDPDCVYISVTDRGLGIDEEEMPKMFTRYFRAKTSTGIAGTGIGLNLSRLLVREHGGEITLQSEKGIGSTFTVCLPVLNTQSRKEASGSC